jgi:hypothetical protein
MLDAQTLRITQTFKNIQKFFSLSCISLRKFLLLHQTLISDQNVPMRFGLKELSKDFQNNFLAD